MDDFKREMHNQCAVGGIKCYCCNPFRGKDKAVLRRIARRVQKRKVKKELDNLVNS